MEIHNRWPLTDNPIARAKEPKATSLRAVNAWCNFAVTDSKSAKEMPLPAFVAPQIHWRRIVNRAARFDSLSHMVLVTLLKSKPRRHLVVSYVPSPFLSFLSKMGSCLSSLLGGKTSCIPCKMPRATCSICSHDVGMIAEMKSST